MPPRLVILSPADNSRFFITGGTAQAGPQMPAITPQVRVDGATPDPTATTSFTWRTAIRFNCATCRNGRHRTIDSDLTETVVGGSYTPRFPEVRGGDVTFTVEATIGGLRLTASTRGIKIGGTNPPSAEVNAALPSLALRRIAMQESGGQRQFLAARGNGTSLCPLFSADHLGGVGIMQVTRPAPTDDEVWDWLANVRRGIRIFNEKQAIARGYPRRVRNSRGFLDLVRALNQRRQPAAPATIQLPDFTPDQLELDTIRGYNGYAGRDRFGLELHEFRVPVDAAGNLQVTIDPATNRGVIAWERVPAADRPTAWGDPHYVEHVLAQNP